MLSDILMPFLDLEAADPIEDYLAALRLFESVADDVDAVIPGHGSVGGAGQLRARIKQDRAYVQALRDGGVPDDPRVGPSAPLEWLPDVHQMATAAARPKRAERDAPTGQSPGVTGESQSCLALLCATPPCLPVVRDPPPPYNPSMPITRLDRGIHAQPSALEQYGGDL